MSCFTLKSRKHGEQDFTVRGDGQRGYVRLGDRQICEGGAFAGETIIATADTLEATARRWWEQHMRRRREQGYDVDIPMAAYADIDMEWADKIARRTAARAALPLPR